MKNGLKALILSLVAVGATSCVSVPGKQKIIFPRNPSLEKGYPSSINLWPNEKILRIECDTDCDMKGDIRYYYDYKVRGGNTIYLSRRPFSIWVDINRDGIYLENEKFYDRSFGEEISPIIKEEKELI